MCKLCLLENAIDIDDLETSSFDEQINQIYCRPNPIENEEVPRNIVRIILNKKWIWNSSRQNFLLNGFWKYDSSTIFFYFIIRWYEITLSPFALLLSVIYILSLFHQLTVPTARTNGKLRIKDEIKWNEIIYFATISSAQCKHRIGFSYTDSRNLWPAIPNATLIFNWTNRVLNQETKMQQQLHYIKFTLWFIRSLHSDSISQYRIFQAILAQTPSSILATKY